MIPMSIEGVRRNFTISSVFVYSVCLIDETGRRLLVLGVERHETLPIVAALNHLTLPRPETINVMVETLKLLNSTLEEVCIEGLSMLPPIYNLCSCMLRWRNGEAVQEQVMNLRPGDAVGLALLMEAPLCVSDELFESIGTPLAEGQTPELVFAQYLLKREGIPLPEGKALRLGHSKTPLRDALVKEFRASLSGKAPLFPEEDMEQRKKAYLAFLLGEGVQSCKQNLRYIFKYPPFADPQKNRDSHCSTLKRVEPRATAPVLPQDDTQFELQYPQAGRTPCNICCRLAICVTILIAVPSSGSNPVQLTAAVMPGYYNSRLQYPQAGRTPCNEWYTPSRYIEAANCSTLKRVEPRATCVP